MLRGAPYPRLLTVFCILTALSVKAAWKQEVYVWQSQWTPQVTASLETSQASLDGIQVLAGEINWKDGKPITFRTQLDAKALANYPRPITLVLRIGPYAGPFDHSDAMSRTIVQQIDAILQSAEAQGVHVSGLQIDFDCAEAKLAGYREWLLAIGDHLNEMHPSIQLSFTSLPAWLHHKDDFQKLAEAADSFVLQVHSLERPTSPDANITLCNPAQSLTWAKDASAIGKPFLVALPTYGYELIFDEDGRFTALVAEGKRPAWQDGTQVRIVRSDPAEMARLEKALKATAPANCEGIVWFRLPIASDRLNWSLSTFLQVLHGETPEPGLSCEAIPSAEDARLVHIVLNNTGDTRMPFPKSVSVMWDKEDSPIAWDAAGVFSVEVNPPKHIATISTNSLSPSASIAPGQSITLAWIRFNQPTVLSIHHDT